MAREIELKFDLEPAMADRILGHPLLAPDPFEAIGPKHLNAIYFDTPDQVLRQAGLTLRIRDDGRGRVQTVKAEAGDNGLLGRGEWETPLDGDAPDLERAAESPISKVLNDAAELRPLFETRVERLTRTLRRDGVEVELSLDRGEVVTPERRAPLNQLELELKEGDPSALFEVARELGEAAPLNLSFETKAQVGYGLLEQKRERPVKAAAVQLRKSMRVMQAFQAIGRACLVQLTANEPLLRRTRSPHALHQMRIALRRLRAAISSFREVAADDRTEQIKADLKWLTGELNAARNLDVFLDETIKPATDEAGELEGLIDLGEAARQAQAEAYDRATAAIQSQRYRDILLETTAWLETGLWASDPKALGRRTREQRVKRFAEAALDHRRKSMKKKGKRLAKLDPAARHELRIAAKKMRYTAEFFECLYTGKKVAKAHDRFIGALKELQDCLGKLNDIATGPEVAAGVLAHGEEPERRSRAMFAAARVIGARAAREPSLMQSAECAYAKFVDAKPFW